jgi:RNA polymerase sigma-70 factor (ECF subfamily)
VKELGQGHIALAETAVIGEDLMSRLRSRDAKTLSSLVHEHTRPLYRAARGMGFREEEAEDLAQDVFTTFFETLDRFEGRSQVRTWLFGILHRKVLERRRDQEKERRIDSIDEVFESRFDKDGHWTKPPADLQRIMESKELGVAITDCLDGLPASQRSVFVFREMEGLPTPEVCKILEVSVTNMSVLMFRARNRLRECMEARGWGRPT